MSRDTLSSLKPTDRRAFLKSSALTAIAGGLLVACGKDVKPQAIAATTPLADSDQSGGAMAAHPAVPSATAAADSSMRPYRPRAGASEH